MNNTSSTVEFSPDGKPLLPSSLKTLTILTFIGCGISMLLLILMPFINKMLMGIMDKARNAGRELTEAQLADMEKGRAVMELTQANLVPIMIIGILSVALCLVGAIMMRKLKKDGFWVYTGGELFPVIANFILLGTAQFTGVTSIVFGVGLPILFVLLYSRQRKYLIA